MIKMICRHCRLRDAQGVGLCSFCYKRQELTSDLACAIERGSAPGEFDCEVRDVFYILVRLSNGDCYSLRMREEPFQPAPAPEAAPWLANQQ